MENENENEESYGWFDWEPAPTDTTGVYYLTIVDADGEEVAIIVHRESELYPLDGELANSKKERAQFIVDALNATL